MCCKVEVACAGEQERANTMHDAQAITTIESPYVFPYVFVYIL